MVTHRPCGNSFPGKIGGGETLCHLAYSMSDGHNNVAYNRHLLDAVNSCMNIKHVVVMSTVSVYGATGERVVDEETTCRPSVEYEESKLACELVWRDGLRDDCRLTILRPSAVIGPGGIGMLTLIRDALDRPVIGSVKRFLLYNRRLHHVAVSNVVAAVLFCLRPSQTIMREVYIVSDDHRPESMSYGVMQDTVRRAVGRRPLPGPAMPRIGLQVLGAVTRRPLALEQTFSSRKLHAAGFEDAITLNEEVKRLVESLKGLA